MQSITTEGIIESSEVALVRPEPTVPIKTST